jgi:hypothetical protein
MKSMFISLLPLIATLALTTQVHGKTVWRCGEGGKTYSETPCPGGRAVDVADSRSSAEVQAARDSIKRDEALASRMRKQRLEDEKRNLAANAGAANLGPSAKPAAQASDKLKPKAKRKPVRQQAPGSSAAAETDTLRAAGVPTRRRRD